MSHVLLVEDDHSVVTLISQYITEINPTITISSFPKAAEALQYVQNHSIDLFILDIQLMDYKGTSLAMQIRALPEHKYTPIVFATALAGEEMMAYREIKCYSFLIKPFTKEEFKQAFCDAIGLSDCINTPSKTIRIEQKQFIFEYELKNIVYIESFGKRIVIHTNRGVSGYQEDTISGYSLMKILELIKDSAIVQCHKSFLVNTAYIDCIDKQQKIIILKDSSTSIPVGSKYQSTLWG